MDWLDELPPELRGAVRTTPPPEWLVPMAATLTKDRFDGDDWLFERKLDGYRYLAFVSGGHARLLTRNRIRHRHPDLEEALLAQPGDDFVLDGELVPFGRPPGGPPPERAYHVFDVLRLDGRDVTELPLQTRKMLLARQFRLEGLLVLVEELPMAGTAAYEHACAQGWEGVIAKRRSSVYEHRRSKAWLKMKCDASQELVVGGFTEPKGSREGMGSLLVGYYDGDDFVFAGRIGTGLSPRILAELRARLDGLETDSPPFTRGTGLPRKGAHWVRPQVVVQAVFMEWTVHGKLRHPRFAGVRDDKAAREVVRES